MNITFHFTASNSIVSRLIRWFSEQPYSHVALEINWTELDGPVVVESTWPNTRPQALEVWKKHSNVVRTINTGWDFAPAVPVLRQHLAAGYGIPELLGMIWVFALRHFTHKWVKDPIDDPNAEFCSELAAAVLKAAKYPGSEKIPALSASPGDIADIISK